MTSLTAPERETVITWSDADKLADIWTAQRPMITKLRKNPDAREVEAGHIGSTAWARFQLPGELVSVRRARAVSLKTTNDSERKRANLAEARAARRTAK